MIDQKQCSIQEFVNEYQHNQLRWISSPQQYLEAQLQMSEMCSLLNVTVLTSRVDKWRWDCSNDDEFWRVLCFWCDFISSKIQYRSLANTKDKKEDSCTVVKNVSLRRYWSLVELCLAELILGNAIETTPNSDLEER
ncbi:hypothetical protein M8C21_033101 [Ambrosia artemisiifolia]|uniref:Uncharacterized protein n=1 Tax=Ambrosia artemisiifolia TaxID=4212 RepID=A0AAD5GKV2_AMBAR|nr:hypothetical protein M8C21_033101 [Ambrosia artemisiifolia]